ncbi:nucleotide exchange factor GrpE [Pseudomaricurvus alkylphenolicus]|uniref:nucleotide exchange factor GrpE n=1 Tax=Pseudomaricurvus alkylphenolicus TaxID=1306991 RepID=UPI0030B8C1FD
MSDEQQTSPDVEEAAAEATEAAAEETTAEAPTVDAIQAEIETLTGELSEAKDHVLRAQAEVQNIRRRAEQDVEKAHKFGQEKLVSDLLPIIDNLERALESIDANDEALKAVIEGVELTLKSFQDTLARHKVEAIHPLGEPFDPQFHQAMSMVESPDAEPNSVINVFQKGYTLHGRLVRPAMVVVAKAAE